MIGKIQPRRDESYWKALLNLVDEIPADQLEIKGDDEYPQSSTSIVNQELASEIAEAWEDALDAQNNETVLKLKVRGFNKGGLLVEWRGLGGFIPASQLNNFPLLHLDEERMHELRRRQNQYLRVRVIEVEAAKNRLIFSERAAMVDSTHRRDLWDEIRIGERRSGIITNMANFGAFVDLGGVEGLIHISELSWSRLNHPGDVVQPGQRVECVVLEVNRHKGRIALSLKQMRPDPWLGVAKRYRPGQLVEGVVSDVVQYGAFVSLEEQLEGLVHVSELAEGNFMHPRNVVRHGDMIKARILEVDSYNRRIALTMRGV